MHYLRTLLNLSGKRIFSVNAALREKLGYTSEDASYILGRVNDLNNLSSNLIGAANKKKLETHLKQNGHFESLEDLLSVHGLGPKSIKRICDKLISIRGDGEGVEVLEPAPTKRFKLPIITPPLSEAQASIIKTVGSVNIGSNEITWAKINYISKNLEAWESMNLDSYSFSKKLDLITLITVCKDVVEKLPVCDTYVLEDVNITSYTGNSSSGLPKNIVTSIISTLIHQPSTGGVPKVVLVGGRAVAKWSGRLIGSEKVSSQSLISDIIIKLNGTDRGMSGMSLASLPILYAEPVLRSSYMSAQPASKEALADAIILALAFIDIAVNRRESLAQSHS